MMASPSPNTRGGLGIPTPRRILLRMYKCVNPAPFLTTTYLRGALPHKRIYQAPINVAPFAVRALPETCAKIFQPHLPVLGSRPILKGAPETN